VLSSSSSTTSGVLFTFLLRQELASARTTTEREQINNDHPFDITILNALYLILLIWQLREFVKRLPYANLNKKYGSYGDFDYFCGLQRTRAHTMAGKLYLVPTPVGNLEDITLRALRILKEVDLILAEDTRTSSILLKHYDIHKPLQSHHKFNEHETSAQMAARIQAGESVALISDAGTPGISDPGFMLVRECVQQGIDVECLPGATAFVPALVDSGLPCDRFLFEGFLPQKKGRQSRIAALKDEMRTIIFYESPFRLVKALEQFIEVFGPERPVAVCREISKVHEECVRGSLTEVLAHFKAHEPKGEIVIVLAGAKN
jgi:16S rRNA (cytidine1402-2'-O)-methyltransferase